jgi:hypothetical protein
MARTSHGVGLYLAVLLLSSLPRPGPWLFWR